MENKSEIGAIIGRFQTSELHEAHVHLIETVLSKHNKVVVFLGVSPILGSKRNPLDFPTRKLMLEEKFGSRINAILPIHDNRDDLKWSKEIDSRIREVFPLGSVTLYGSRDSFIPHYLGAFKTIELESKIYVSATDIRKTVSEKILSSKEFRAGVIYSTYNKYPVVFSTVDVAIVNDSNELLLGRKNSDPINTYRFVGGFVDPTDADDYAACRREAFEETRCVVEPYEYVASAKVNDWRYRKEEDMKIMTRLFLAKYVSGRVEPSDDIHELKWVSFDKLSEVQIVEEHRSLFEILILKLNNK